MLLEGKRVTILDGSIYSGSIARVESHADGLVSARIEKGVGRGRVIVLMDLLVGPVVTIDDNSLKICSLMAPEADAA